MKAREISVGITDDGQGEIHVWCVSFRLKGSLPRPDGKVDEASRRSKEKEIAKLIASLDFPGE